MQNKVYFYATLYAGVLYLVREKKINIRLLSTSFGFSERHLYKFVREAKPIQFSLLNKLCGLMGVSLTHLLLVSRIGCWFTNKEGEFVSLSEFYNRYPKNIFNLDNRSVK